MFNVRRNNITRRGDAGHEFPGRLVSWSTEFRGQLITTRTLFPRNQHHRHHRHYLFSAVFGVFSFVFNEKITSRQNNRRDAGRLEREGVQPFSCIRCTNSLATK